MEENKKHRYSHRILARIIIEAATPLAVGSGEKDILTDALVATDVNNLPYIPATAIAGVLRSMIESEAGDTNHLKNDSEWTPEIIDNIFGFQTKDKGRGSEIIFTEAKILNHNGKAIDGMEPYAISNDSLLKHYQELPIRQHVRINSRGTAEKGGKYDQQIVYTGTRFCFEVEMVSDTENIPVILSILRKLYDKSFRIGGGTRNGFGEINVVELKIMDLNLQNPQDLQIYLEKTSALDTDFWQKYADKKAELIADSNVPEGYVSYTLSLTPDSFFQFGSGYGDSEADMTPVKTAKVVWKDKNGHPEGHLEENLVFIPATSVKGALAHRVGFHWNRIKGIFADDMNDADFKKMSEEKNDAVKALFGSEGSKDKDFTRGNVIFSDLILDNVKDEKILNHIAIDPYTGGGIEGALFSEKAVYGNRSPFKLVISVDERKLKKDVPEIADEALEALKLALNDLCKGYLPLGGGVNRGHGIFTGTCQKTK